MVRDYGGLAAYLDARRARPLEWGSRANDCASRADGALVAQGARSVIRELRLNWTTRLGAARVLKRVGGLAGALDRSRQLRRTPCALAQRGDLGLINAADGPCLVVVEGDTVSGPGPAGVLHHPRELMTVAWTLS